MFKFFLIAAQFFLVILVILFIISNSFIISFELNDFIYSVSSSYIVIILLAGYLVLFILQSFYFKTKFSYSKYKINKFLKFKNKGFDSFVSGMIAVANKDYKTAIVESKKISNSLDDNRSLSLLLKSEIFKIEKKYDELKNVYLEMINNKATENLGIRGMMEQYIKSQDYHHAFIYGEKLFNNNPNIEKIYDALVNIISKTNNWQQLIYISEKAFNKKIISKKLFNVNKSIGLFEIAKIKQFSEVNESINYLEKALNIRKNFPPYVNLYLEILIQNKDYNKAKKFLKKVWGESPHPEFKSKVSMLANKIGMEIIDLVKLIISNNPQNETSKILLVESFIHSKKWNLARNSIQKLLDVNPKKEVCLLMAKIEEGETGDIQKVKSWSMRANNGADKNVWVCMFTAKAQNEWSSVSKGGYFNSLEWKQPYMLNNDLENIERFINYEN